MEPVLKKSLNDDIVQIGLIVTLISGVFLGRLLLMGHSSAPAAPVRAVAPANPANPPVAQPVPRPAPVPVAERGYAGDTGGGLAQKSKVKGRWVVDAAGGAEADVATIAQAVLNAENGDRIEIKPGRYKETLVLNKDLTLVGLPTADGKIGVTIEQGPTGGHTITVVGGKSGIESLDIVQSLPHLAGVYAKAGSVHLANIVFHAPVGTGLFVMEGDVTADHSAFTGSTGIEQWGGNLVCNDCTTANNTAVGVAVGVSNKENGVAKPKAQFHNLVSKNNGQVGFVAYNNADVKLDGCEISGNLREGFGAAQKAVVQAKGCTIKDNVGGGFVATQDSSVEVIDSKISRNEDGFRVVQNANVTVRGSEIFENLRYGYGYSQDNRVLLVESRLRDNRRGDKAAIQAASAGPAPASVPPAPGANPPALLVNQPPEPAK